jgi:isoleucyl-tRNA synthetase
MEDVPERHDFPAAEEAVSALWDKIDAFQTSLKRSEGKPRFSFYDGPPFATGLPHYGHILAGTIKDTVTRYAHQNGFYVERRFGWDCHGLPIEFEIDKQLGIKTQEQVLAFGIGNYNEECRKIVMRYSSEWERVVKRLGRWIDFKNDYKTMDTDFMESVWWVFSQLWKKDLVYRGFKVMPYSTGCTTPISNFEAGLAYKDVQDPAIVVHFPLVEDPSVSFVAWTTTPWTLPSNLGLCVHPEFTYVQVKHKTTGAQFIVNHKLVASVYKDPTEYDVVKTFQGKELVGKKYVPLFDYFVKQFPNAFRVVSDTYVTESDGTGIVHQAPAFGEDDNRVCIREKICSNTELPCPINDDGKFTNEVPHFVGKYVKDADSDIIKHLQKAGRLVSRSTLNHSYPFCWRSDTPLLYRAVPSWFVKVSELRERLLKNNSETYWVPDFVKEKRFHNWLADARDWAISRNRYWGTPLPIWVSEDYEERIVVTSVEHLYELSGKRVTDLHRHFLDDITIPSQQGKGLLHRVPEVFDCWFESGSMPYAQQHYPFENEKVFDESFPADFIAEGVDQTRGWFYTLLVLSTALFDKPPFKNLIVNGLVLAADGKKMSKRLKNYPDPVEVINKYGADALRLYLINSPVVKAETLKFQESGVDSVLKDVFLRWYNAYRFLTQNVTRIKVETGKDFVYDASVGTKTQNVMDKWLLASTQSLIAFVRQEMAAYRLYTVVPKLVKFIESLANWYVKLNRARLKGQDGPEEEQNSLSTLALVLFTLCRAMAPFTPFFVEHLYQNLKHLLPVEEREDSVHYLPFPEVGASLVDEAIETHVARMQEVIELGRLARDLAICPNRQPLSNYLVFHEDPQYLASLKYLEPYILSELSVSNLVLRSDVQNGIVQRVKPNHRLLGPKVKKQADQVNAALAALSPEEVAKFIATGTITLCGVEILKEEVFIVPEFKGGDGTTKYQPSGNSNVVCVLDLTKDQSSFDGRLYREFVNRIQRLRKAAKLVHTDHVVCYYHWSVSAEEQSDYELDRVIAAQRQTIEQTTHCSVVSQQLRSADHLVLAQQTVNLLESVDVTLVLARPDVAVNREAVSAVASPLGLDTIALERFLLTLSDSQLSSLTKDNALTLSLDSKTITLVKDKHFFSHAGEYAKAVSYPTLPPTIVKKEKPVKAAKPVAPAPAKKDKAAPSKQPTEKKTEKSSKK